MGEGKVLLKIMCPKQKYEEAVKHTLLSKSQEPEWLRELRKRYEVKIIEKGENKGYKCLTICEKENKESDFDNENEKAFYFFENLKYKFYVCADKPWELKIGNEVQKIEEVVEKEENNERKRYHLYLYTWKNWIGWCTIKCGDIEFTPFIHSTKMDDELDYMRMIIFIENTFRRIAYEFFSPVHIYLQRAWEYGEDIFIERLEKLWKRVKVAMFFIEKDPHKKIVKREVKRFIWQAKGNNPRLGKHLAKEGQWIEVKESNLSVPVALKEKVPLHIVDVVNEISYDTIPNRFLSFFFTWIERKLDRIIKYYEKKGKDSDKLRIAGEVLRDARRLRNLEFLRDVPPLADFNINTLVLVMDRNYSIVWNVFQELRRILTLSFSELYDYSIYPIEKLYELFIFCAVIKTLEKAGYKIENQTVIKKTMFDYQIELKRGKVEMVKKKKKEEEENLRNNRKKDEIEKIIVYYHRGFTSENIEEKRKKKEPYTPLIRLIPDITIEIKEGKNKKSRWIFLEGKYMRKEKVEELNEKIKSEEDEEREGIETTGKIFKERFVAEAIKAVHAYLDGIKVDEEECQNDKQNGKKNQEKKTSHKTGVAVYPGIKGKEKFNHREREALVKNYNIDVLGLLPRRWEGEMVEGFDRWVCKEEKKGCFKEKVIEYIKNEVIKKYFNKNENKMNRVLKSYPKIRDYLYAVEFFEIEDLKPQSEIGKDKGEHTVPPWVVEKINERKEKITLDKLRIAVIGEDADYMCIKEAWKANVKTKKEEPIVFLPSVDGWAFGKAGKFDIIHVGTHFEIGEKEEVSYFLNPFEDFVLVNPYAEKEKKEPVPLSPYDLFYSQAVSPNTLVVLAVCNGALEGEKIFKHSDEGENSQETEGRLFSSLSLADVFILMGARTVVATENKIEDTEKLVNAFENFYDELLKGKDVNKALSKLKDFNFQIFGDPGWKIEYTQNP